MSEEKTIIFTTNEEEYHEAMKILDKLGYKWLSGAACEEWSPTLSWIMKTLYVTLHEESKTITVSPTKPDLYPLSLKVFEQLKGTEPSFTKADLEDGMIVRIENRYYIYFKKIEKFVGEDGFFWVDSYNDDLTHKYGRGDFSITAVFVMKDLCSLILSKDDDGLEKIWERPEEKVYMTVSEVEKKLGIKNLVIVEKVEQE